MFCEVTIGESMTKRKNINLSQQTWKNLDERRSPGQSFDGVITELIQGVKNEGRS